MNKKLFACLSLFAAAHTANAATIDVELTNLTQGLYFTPVLISAHDDNVDLFTLGSAASSELQAMAEGGDISGLEAQVDSLGGVNVANPAGGLLMPAQSTQVSDFDTGDYNQLSLAAMILPTNDGFIGLDSWHIPSEPGTYTIYLNAYDAGTEANNELVIDGSGAPGVAGIPANPGANGGINGSGVTNSESNTHIHVHRGNLGDSDLAGGSSDLSSSVHRWLNPVAKLVVTVQ